LRRLDIAEVQRNFAALAATLLQTERNDKKTQQKFIFD
jgi:hypothetical protein